MKETIELDQAIRNLAWSMVVSIKNVEVMENFIKGILELVKLQQKGKRVTHVEKTLEEKFYVYYSSYIYKPTLDEDVLKHLADIAKEHYEGKE